MAAWVAALCAVNAATAAEPLTPDDVIARVAASHPALRLADARGELLAAENDRGLQQPPLQAGMQLENFAGTGVLGGLRGAEVTLTLASVLERGGKLDARRTLARSRIDALAVERETQRLDLLAEVARRYLAASAALLHRDIAALDLDQRRRTETAARQRLQAGASPESVVLAAQAARALAELSGARAAQQWTAARQHLAALWGERTPAFTIVTGDPLFLPEVPDATALAALLDQTPELERFADQRRIAEARLQLARTTASADLQWQAGVRYLGTSDDVGLVAGVALPLGTRRRAGPDIRAANADLATLEIEREAASLSLYSTLIEAHGRYTVAQLETARLRDEVLPLLVRAEAAAERAWRAGATSYLEWSGVQSELTATRRRQLDIALDGQRALIEIQRLTGQSFVGGTGRTQGNLP
jgi:cobalt-zinc-cadmium efflux system outer membrane protein